MCFWPGGWSGLMSIAGSIAQPVGEYLSTSATNAASAEQAELNRTFNAGQAEVNRSFQEKMSNSAWQRGTEDMEAAGINPMLAVSQGGASSPSGGTASGSAAPVENPHLGSAIGRGMSSAMEVANTAADLKNKEATNSQIKAQTEVANRDAELKKQSAYKTHQEATNAALENHRRVKEFGAQTKEYDVRSSQADWDKWSQDYDNYLEKIRAGTGVVGSAFDMIPGKKMIGDILDGKLSPRDATGRTRRELENQKRHRMRR